MKWLAKLFRRNDKILNAKTESEILSLPENNILPTFCNEGVLYTFPNLIKFAQSPNGLLEWAANPQYGSLCSLYLAQLVEEGIAQINENSFLLAWSDIYYLHTSDDHLDSIYLLGLPKIKKSILSLVEKGTLSDSNFIISLNGYIDPQGRLVNVKKMGAIFTKGKESWLVSAAEWMLISHIMDFEIASSIGASQTDREVHWGRIRAAALEAGAKLSAYLASVLVLTPNNLIINYSRENVSGIGVVVIEPTFVDAPEKWLTTFDALPSIPKYLDFPSNNGRIRVIFTDLVQSVLQTIKSEFPGRRAGGVKAEAFIRNPFAFLGEDASRVIDPEQIEYAKEHAGIIPTRLIFTTPNVDNGCIKDLVGLIQQIFKDGTSKTTHEKIASPDELFEIINILRLSYEEDRQFFRWRSHIIDIDGDTHHQLDIAFRCLSVWQAQVNSVIKFDDIYTFQYAERVDGIGVAKPIYSAYVQKEGGDKTPWVQENLTPLVTAQLTPDGPPVFIRLDTEWIDEFQIKIEQAKLSKHENIFDSRLPIPISIMEAEKLHANLIKMLESDISKSIKDEAIFDIKEDSTERFPNKPAAKESLLIKANANQLDYSEMQHAIERESLLKVPSDYSPSIPSSKKSEIDLKQHQIEGVAWLQHLVSHSPKYCRGAVLADDMGLGKTLQLLTVLAAHYEKEPLSSPSLIIAPIALMKNWSNEAMKFYNYFPEILVLHGENIRARRQPKSLIDKELLDRKISNLLIPNWIGSAKVVLTTYEALRDYEFSLAKQDFYFLICDEAQRIKNPNALVTLAVKKQKSNFRIACTGTPVENTLADLWCLFDFIQPGLLGDLSDFSKKYRQSIEGKSEGQESVRDMLKNLIEPQILRRMKEDVVDLPKKINVSNDKYEFENKLRERLSIQMSHYQREIYLQGVDLLHLAKRESNSQKRVSISFDVLHLIKAVCAEPYCLPGKKFNIDLKGHDTHLFNSPKLKWTLDQLTRISAANEKVIIFTELRQVQRALLIFINHLFGFTPLVINGDTEERQDVVDQFQNKRGFGVIILSPLAAGFGLNIVSANHVIHYSRTWNPAKEGQATDRAYRIGQTKNVYVYCPTIIANDFVTFEDKLDRIMSIKMDLAGDILDGVGSDISFSELMPDGGPFGSEIKYDEIVDMVTVDSLSTRGVGFEIFCKILLSKSSYISYVTPEKGDGGVDVVIIFNDETGYICQCKCASQAELGWDAVKEVVGGRAAYQAKHPNILFQPIAITNRQFNSAAKLQASINGVRLIERDEISEMLFKQPIKRIVLDEELLRN